MTSLLILVGVVLSSLTIYAQIKSQPGINMNAMTGAWYVVGLARVDRIVLPFLEKPGMGKFSILQTSGGNLDLSYRLSHAPFLCMVNNGSAKKTDVVGLFHFKSKNRWAYGTFIKAKEDEFAFLKFSTNRDLKRSSATLLLTRTKDPSAAVKEEWKKFCEDARIKPGNIEWLPMNGVPATPLFPTGGDMLDFLVQSGDISDADGLLATWFHRANSKEQMNIALAGGAMILEADVTLEGYGTPEQKLIPIMAHPPDIYSDNTLEQWLDAVLASRKGIKLDFKSLASVGPSLDILDLKNRSTGINRPVWLNADVLPGPNVPSFVPTVNGTRFLQLVQEKFPDVTLSPGWMVLYLPPLFNETYSRKMVEEMFEMIRDVPQKVTFPVHALLVRRGWQHISWLLSQSPRFSLTLWQGEDHPPISDLLFVRDNSNPSRIYYDLQEPTMSQFQQAAGKKDRLRKFYPGGNLMDFLQSAHRVTNRRSEVSLDDSLAVRWSTLTHLDSLKTLTEGMLVLRVTSDLSLPGVPVVETSRNTSEVLTLQRVLQELGRNPSTPVGIYLQVQDLLEVSLNLLMDAYATEQLYRPVWIHAEALQNISDLVSTVERSFPFVTLVLTEQTLPLLLPNEVSQSRAVLLNARRLLEGGEELWSLMDRWDVVVVDQKPGTLTILEDLMKQRRGRRKTHNVYLMQA